MSTTFYRHEVSYLYYFGQSTLSNQREFRSVGLLLIAGSGVASWSAGGGGGGSRNSSNLRPRRSKPFVRKSRLRGELTNELVTRSAPGWREVRSRHQSHPISGRSEFGAHGNGSNGGRVDWKYICWLLPALLTVSGHLDSGHKSQTHIIYKEFIAPSTRANFGTQHSVSHHRLIASLSA